MEQPDGAGRRTGVLAGARVRRLPRLIGLILGAFLLVEAVLLGLGLLITRGLDDGPVAAEEIAFERTSQARAPRSGTR